jgi:hypothetical protein
MARPGTIHVEAIGTQKLLRKLDGLHAKVRDKIVRNVLSKATTVMKQEIVKRTPVGTSAPVDEKGKPRKRLKKGFSKRLKLARDKDGIHGVVGIPPDYPRFVYMLHYGIPAHKIAAKNGKRLSFAGGMYKSVNHPGVRQMDFMRDALVASIPKSRSIMGSELRSRLASVAK